MKKILFYILFLGVGCAAQVKETNVPVEPPKAVVKPTPKKHRYVVKITHIEAYYVEDVVASTEE